MSLDKEWSRLGFLRTVKAVDITLPTGIPADKMRSHILEENVVKVSSRLKSFQLKAVLFAGLEPEGISLLNLSGQLKEADKSLLGGVKDISRRLYEVFDKGPTKYTTYVEESTIPTAVVAEGKVVGTALLSAEVQFQAFTPWEEAAAVKVIRKGVLGVISENWKIM